MFVSRCIFQNSLKYRQISTFTIERLITKEDVNNFAKLSGDNNQIHSGENALVHGALLNAYVSAVMGTKLPGHGTIVASQKFKFPLPCYCGDSIVITVELQGEERKFATCIFNVKRKSDDKIVMAGEAKLLLKNKHNF